MPPKAVDFAEVPPAGPKRKVVKTDDLARYDSTGAGGGGPLARSDKKDTEQSANFSFAFDEEKKEVKEENNYMAQKVKVLFIATSFGQSLARDIEAAAMRLHLLRGPPGKRHVTKSLIDLNGVPLINYWISQLRKSERMQPIEKSFYILCNEDNYEEFAAWATDSSKCQLLGGFPLDHIISNGESMKSGDFVKQGYVKDISVFAEKSGWAADPTHLMLVDGDYVMNPDFSINGVIEHSIILGKDTLCYHAMEAEEHSKELHHILEIDATPVMPRVTAVLPNPGRGVTSSKLIAGPMYLLRKTSVPLVSEWVAKAGRTYSANAAWGHFLAWLVKRDGPTTHAIRVPHVFDVLTIRNLMYVDGLLGLMGRKKRDAQQLTRVSDTDSSLEFKTAFSGTSHKKIQEHDRREAELEADISEAEAGLRARQLRGVGAVEISTDATIAEYDPQFEVILEAKIRSAKVALNKRDKQHAKTSYSGMLKNTPFYLTSNSIYGSTRSTVGLYGLNYKQDGILSPSRSVDREAYERAEGF